MVVITQWEPMLEYLIHHHHLLLMVTGVPGDLGAAAARLASLLTMTTMDRAHRPERGAAMTPLLGPGGRTAAGRQRRPGTAALTAARWMEAGGPGAAGAIAPLLVVEAFGQRQENAMILLRNLMEPTAKGFPMRNQNVMHKSVPLMEIGGRGAPGVSAVLLVVEAFGQRQESAMILLRHLMEPTAKDLPMKN